MGYSPNLKHLFIILYNAKLFLFLYAFHKLVELSLIGFKFSRYFRLSSCYIINTSS